MHLQMVEADEALSPVVTWHNEPDRGFTSLHDVRGDLPGRVNIEITRGKALKMGLNFIWIESCRQKRPDVVLELLDQLNLGTDKLRPTRQNRRRLGC